MPKADIHIDLAKLPAAAERQPANVELVPPAPALEAEMALRTKQSEQMARAQMGNAMRVQPNLAAVVAESKAPPPAAAPSAEELAAMKVRAQQTKPEAETPPINATVAGAAAIIVNHLCSLSSDWGQKIAAMRSERGLRDDQICAALIAIALDMNLHMTVPSDHPYFAESFKAAGTNYECLICGTVGSRAYPGQPPICITADQKCARIFHAMSEADKQELLEAAA